MAARIAAHVTVAYPQEAPIGNLLVERIREASRNVRPFRLGLGGLGCFECPEGGVYVYVDVDVEDLDGGYRRLREEILRPPFHGVTYPPHVTLVHPQTSCRGREFWDSGCYQRQDQRFTAEEVTITAFNGVELVALMTCRLGSGDRDESRGHRLTTRSGRPRPRDVRPAR
jgi:hypothetical protein